jgi:hypothetical protein
MTASQVACTVSVTITRAGCRDFSRNGGRASRFQSPKKFAQVRVNASGIIFFLSVGRFVMSDILISCPETGRPVPTGLTTDIIILETCRLSRCPCAARRAGTCTHGNQRTPGQPTSRNSVTQPRPLPALFPLELSYAGRRRAPHRLQAAGIRRASQKQTHASQQMTDAVALFGPLTSPPGEQQNVRVTIAQCNLCSINARATPAGKGRPDVERNTLPCSDRDADISIDICRAGAG